MSRRPFSKYKNNILVESGTYIGDGIQDALQNGFSKIISFEIQPDLYNISKERFSNNPNVTVVLGSSAKELFNYIKDINEPITFWLDGHYSLGITGYDTDNICPLIRELEQINQHHLKNHTILIDDRRLLKPSFNKGLDTLFNISEIDVILKLKEINKNYKITYEEGHFPNDIIVAKL